MTTAAVLGALLVAIATAMPAHARTEVMGGGPSHRGVTHAPAEGPQLPGDGATPAKTEAAASPGGAIYNPFAPSSDSNVSHVSPAKNHVNSDSEGMGLAFVAALAGVAVLGHILRRAMKAH